MIKKEDGEEKNDDRFVGGTGLSEVDRKDGAEVMGLDKDR